MQLFVYGTLMSQEVNASWMSEAEFLFHAATLPLYTFVDMGGFPALVPGGAKSVTGEVYRVDSALLRALDRLEEHPDFYYRTSILLEGGMQAQTYLLSAEVAGDAPRIDEKDWRSYRRSQRGRMERLYAGE